MKYIQCCGGCGLANEYTVWDACSPKPRREDMWLALQLLNLSIVSGTWKPMSEQTIYAGTHPTHVPETFRCGFRISAHHNVVVGLIDSEETLAIQQVLDTHGDFVSELSVCTSHCCYLAFFELILPWLATKLSQNLLIMTCCMVLV